MPTKQPTAKSRTEPRNADPVSRETGQAFERFLRLPVPVVLMVLWVAGVVFFGACAMLAYVGISALWEMVAGTF